MQEFLFSDGHLDGFSWREDVFVPEGLRYLKGHFPGNPMVPGVAQVVTIAEERARFAWPDLGAVTGLRRLKFMSALRPGDQLVLRLERKPGKVVFRIHCAESECSKGTLLFA